MKIAILTVLTLSMSLGLFAQQTINQTVHFDYDKFNLTVETKTMLESCYEKIEDNNLRQITIIGHTDTDGNDSYNMTLSENRTKAVLNYFLSKGISKEKIKIQFYGESKPIAKNDKEQDKQQNRRVEIIIEKSSAESYERFKKQAQIFIIVANKDTTIVCSEGTIIKIKANSFISESTGKEIDGNIKFSVKEFYKISDMLLSNLSTTSNGQLLETAGMVYITATANDENCKLKKGQGIELNFPTKEKENDMQLFSGSLDDENHINWTEIQMQNTQEIFTVVEEMPKFPGGEKDLSQYLANTVKYPQQARELGVQGTVYITFVISETGEVNEPRVIRGVSSELNLAALDAIKKMPKWIPGKQRGQNVRVQYSIPIKFDLGDTSMVGEGDFKDRFEKSFTDTTIQQASSSNIMYYIFNSTALGWINWDRYIKSSPKVNYIVKLDNDVDNTSVRIIFESYKAVMDVYSTKGAYYFKDVPSGEKITIVAIKRVDNKPYLAMKQTKTSSKVEKDLVFQPVTMEMLKIELKKLDRFN